MYKLLEYIRSEFYALFRDGGALLLLVVALPLYTIIYSTAYGGEVVHDVPIAVVDEDRTPSSRALIGGLMSGPNTLLCYEPSNMAEARELFYSNKAFGIVYIPNDFERHLLSGSQANIGVILDGSHLLLYRQVLEQVATDALTQGAGLELMRLTEQGAAPQVAAAVVEPMQFDVHHLYNRALGYGSFVMPSVMIVIVQQTLVIGLSMMAARRRQQGLRIEPITPLGILSKILVYIFIYGANLTILLTLLWPAFGFVFNAKIGDVALFLLLYVVASLSFAIALSQLFKRREAPLLLLLWSSVPILLLAGVSYPREAYAEWIYHVGRIFPSSSGVDGFIALASRGATLSEVATELATLAILTVIYLALALIINKSLLARQKF